MGCWCMFFKVFVYSNYFGVVPLLLFQQYQNYWMGFQTHLMLGSLTKIFQHIQIWLKWEGNDAHYTRRRTFIFACNSTATGCEFIYIYMFHSNVLEKNEIVEC